MYSAEKQIFTDIFGHKEKCNSFVFFTLVDFVKVPCLGIGFTLSVRVAWTTSLSLHLCAKFSMLKLLKSSTLWGDRGLSLAQFMHQVHVKGLDTITEAESE